MRDEMVITPGHPHRVRLLQLTDPHILGDRDARFDGMDTAASLDTVLAAVKALEDTPDVVLMTGDLAHEPEPAAYERLAQQLRVLEAPVFCLPGNHDDPDMMHERMNRDGISTCKAVAAGDWRMVLLDTWEQGTHGGRLSPRELDFLRERLAAANGYWVLIALHHPPVSIDSPWMDAMGLANPGDFFAIIDECPAVRGVIWGHIHQDFYHRRRGVHLFGTPSTCIQFLPGADHYERDARPPGFRELILHADGSLESRVRRCAGRTSETG